jgi:hypothetical protein
MTTILERVQAYLDLAIKATHGPWDYDRGGDDCPAVVYQVSDEIYPNEIARELLEVDAEFIAASRTEAPYLAHKLWEALIVLEGIEMVTRRNIDVPKLHDINQVVRHFLESSQFVIPKTDSDVRHKAASILNGHKLEMLEEAGLMVVDRQEWVDHQLATAAMRRALVNLREAVDEIEAMERK